MAGAFAIFPGTPPIWCCVYGLNKCSDGSDSGLRVKASSVTAGTTYKYTDGNCYTINTSPSPACGTLISSSSLTAVTGCSDSACVSTVCPTCPGTLPTSVLLGGFGGGHIVNCGGADPFTAADCNTTCFSGVAAPVWNNQMTGPACGPPGYSFNATTTTTIVLSDGTCTQILSAQLQCRGGSGGSLVGYGGPALPGWGMEIVGGPSCSGKGENWTVWYYKVGAASQFGTYTLGSTLLGGCFGGSHITPPGTVTIS